MDKQKETKLPYRYTELANRHSELIDRKYLDQLTNEEQTELEQIIEEMEGLEGEFYAPIIDRLKAEKNEIEKILNQEEKRG